MRARVLPVAINLAASHLREPSLPAQVEQVLAHYGLPPASLEIEVTESVMLSDPEDSIRNALRLSQLGVRLALDDFGMGYSSLSYLKRLPVSYLKIDKSFVSELSTDASSAAIITAIIAMAHTLGLGVVAEGVEHEVQRSFLRKRGCDDYQGYLFSRPVEPAAFEALLQEQALYTLGPVVIATPARRVVSA